MRSQSLIVLVLLLLVMPIFSAVFPDEIPGTPFTFFREDSGSLEVAYYNSPDGSLGAIIEIHDMKDAEWNVKKTGYADKGFSSHSCQGNTYFYKCNGPETGRFSTWICSLDSYSEGKYYLVDVFSEKKPEDDLLGVGISVGHYFIEGKKLEKPPSAPHNTYEAEKNIDIPHQPESSVCPFPIAFIIILSSFFMAYR